MQYIWSAATSWLNLRDRFLSGIEQLNTQQFFSLFDNIKTNHATKTNQVLWYYKVSRYYYAWYNYFPTGLDFYCHLYLRQAHSQVTSGNVEADPQKSVLKVQHIIVLTAKHIIDIQQSINDTKPFLSKETLTTESNQLRKVAEKCI